MASYFTSEFFASNRRRLREQTENIELFVLAANGQMQYKADETYKFRQDSSFWYLTGLDLPDAILVMDQSEEYLIVPERSFVRAFFEGGIDEELIAKTSGITQIYNEKTGWEKLKKQIQNSSHAGTLLSPPAFIVAYGMYTNPARAKLIRRLRRLNSGLELKDLRPVLAHMRQVKQAPELAALQKAVDITVETIQEVTSRPALKKYQYEYQIEADINRGFRFRGALGTAFDSIVSSGPRNCILHNFDASAKLSADELLLMDVGADISHYGADITRTVSLGKTSKRQEQVFNAVCDVQDYAYSLLKPGVVPIEYEKQVEYFMGEKLLELGVIKVNDHESVRRFFPHMTSHFLGLDTHDVGDYHRPHDPGVVVVVEVGIYIPAEGIGVRIEDDVVITQDGYRNLNAGLSRELL